MEKKQRITDTKDNRTRRYRIGWIVSIFVFMIALILSIGVILTLRKNLSFELKENAKEEMSRVSDSIEKSVSANFISYFSQLRIVSSLFSDYATINNSNREEIVKMLSTVHSGISFRNVGLLLENGDVLLDSGEVYSIYASVLAEKIVVEGKSYIDTLSLIGDETYFVFGIPFSGASAISRLSGTGDLPVCGVVGVADTQSVAALFVEGAYYGDNIVAVTKDDGFLVCTSQNAEEDEKPLNFVTYLRFRLSQEEFDGFYASYESGGRVAFDVALNDRYDYYMTCSSFVGEDYLERFRIFVYIPTPLVTQSTDELFNGMFAIITCMVAISIILSSVTVFFVLNNRNNKMLLKKREEANELLSMAAKAANEASTAKSNFLSGISHDIRTPINGIIGMTGLALDNLDDREKVVHCLDKISGASRHLLALVNDVLDISRIESGKVEIRRRSESIGMLLDNCLSVIEGQYVEKGVALETDFGPFGKKFFLLDALHVHQILINILGNAVKFTPVGGRVVFSCKEETSPEGKTALCFSVKDNGCGMSKEFCKRVFEPFVQEKSARFASHGSGLGMTISASLASLMDGKISVESELGVGSVFTFLLPVEVCDAPPTEEPATDRADVVGVRVLLAEDNALNREFVTERLRKNGAIVTEAENGKVAYDIFRKGKEGAFDVILMDLMMPEMDGYTAAKLIRSLGREDARRIPIVALTANAFAEDLQKCLDVGMNDHVVKPFEFDRLYSVINRQIGRKKAEPEEKSDDEPATGKAADGRKEGEENGARETPQGPTAHGERGSGSPAPQKDDADLSSDPQDEAFSAGKPATLDELYALLGGSAKDVILRLQGERILRKLLAKFPEDKSFESLGEALRAGDAPTAFRHAHTMKGLCLNFGFGSLSASVSELTELLRNRDTVPDGAEDLFRRVSEDYRRTTDAVRDFLGEP